jgi:hypothetical protein
MDPNELNFVDDECPDDPGLDNSTSGKIQMTFTIKWGRLTPDQRRAIVTAVENAGKLLFVQSALINPLEIAIHANLNTSSHGGRPLRVKTAYDE